MVDHEQAVLIVGFGASAENLHWRAIKSVYADGTDIVVVDVDQSRREVARSLGAAGSYAEVEGSANARPFELSLVTTPNQFHGAGVSAVRTMSHRVLVEKPAVIRSADLAEFGVENKVLTVHNLVFDPGILATRDVIASGAIGDVRELRMAHYMPNAFVGSWPQQPRWRESAELSGGGALIDIGYHLLYVAEFLCGETLQLRSATAEWAEGLVGSVDVDTDARLQAGPVVVRVRVSWQGHRDVRHIEVRGSLGKVLLDDQGRLAVRRRDRLVDVKRFESGLAASMAAMHREVRAWRPASHTPAALSGMQPRSSLRLFELIAATLTCATAPKPLGAVWRRT